MPVMTGPGVRDPEDPDQWLVAPWPADASLWDVVQHFQQVSCTQFDAGTSNARLLAFHEGLYAALTAAPPTEEFANQTELDRRSYVLSCANLGVRVFQDLATAHGRDPQVGEDEHVQAIKHRNNPPTSPGP
jgi:hypothetical protein